MNLRYRNGVGKTIRKTLRNRYLANAAVNFIAAGTGYELGICTGTMTGAAIQIVTGRLLEYALRRFTDLYEGGEAKLSEILGRAIPDARFGGVSEFWTRVTERHISGRALVEITGLLSPYGPLMPSHPMSRPGYTIEGWETLGELETEDTEEYDSRDSYIYGDRVIRFSSPRHGKFFGGLYDAYYGLANVAIPLYIDYGVARRRPNNLLWLWKEDKVGGRIVKIKGRLFPLANYYAQFTQLPERFRMLPNCGLEVFEIVEVKDIVGVTHMSVTVAWKRKRSEGMLTHYFNVQDSGQFDVAESLLDVERKRRSRSLLFNYDDVSCASPTWKYRMPEYNEMLRPWLEGAELP